MMKLNPLFVAILATLMFTSVAQAADKAEEESPPSNSIELIGYRGDVAAKIYFEHGVTENFAVSLNIWKSKGFVEVTVGPAYYITPEVEVGAGIGTSRYMADDAENESSHRVATVWGYIKNDAMEGEITVSRYASDPNPWYYQAYAQWSVGGNWSAGVYGEADVGWGPRLAFTPHKRVTLWIAPIAKKLGDDNNKVVGGVAFVF